LRIFATGGLPGLFEMMPPPVQPIAPAFWLVVDDPLERLPRWLGAQVVHQDAPKKVRRGCPLPQRWQEVRLDDKKRNRFSRKPGATHEERLISAYRRRRRFAKGAKLSQDLARPDPYLGNVG
jgi:hypothetical protein